MVIRRTVGRKQEKRQESELVRYSRETRITIEKEVPEAPQQVVPTVPRVRTAFEEFGGAHGLICVAQMLCNAHLLTIVLCREMHCGQYQDLYYFLCGFLGCIGGFCSADKEDGLGLGGLGRWAMRLQIVLIMIAAIDCKDLECQCLMPYPKSDRLMYMLIKQYSNIVSILAFLFHLVLPRFEGDPSTTSLQLLYRFF